MVFYMSPLSFAQSMVVNYKLKVTSVSPDPKQDEKMKVKNIKKDLDTLELSGSSKNYCRSAGTNN